jgi:hypothetical protein
MPRIASDACCCIFNIRSSMVSKHSELTKGQARDRYERFTSPSSHTTPSRQEVGSSRCSHTAPPPSRQEVESSSHRRTAPPPSSDDSIEDV